MSDGQHSSNTAAIQGSKLLLAVMSSVVELKMFCKIDLISGCAMTLTESSRYPLGRSVDIRDEFYLR